MKKLVSLLLALSLVLALVLSLTLLAPDALAATILEVGSSGSDVTKVQNKLIQYGYMTGAADGRYGEKTRDAVIWFQQRNGLTVDGRVGSKTAAALGITLSGSSSAATTASSSSASIVSADHRLLAKLVYAEARGEPYKGQVAVRISL